MDLRNTCRWIPFIAVTAALVAVLSRADMKKSLDAIKHARLAWISGVLVLTVLNTWIEAMRWKPILNSVKKGINTHVAFSAVLMGITGNTFLPFRLGDSARIFYMAAQGKITPAESFSTVVLDHLADTVFFLFIVACSFLFFPFPPSIKTLTLYAGGALVLGLAVFLLVVRWNARARSSPSGKALQWTSEQLRRFASIFSTLLHIRFLLPVVFWFAFSWFVRLAMVFAGLKAFHPDLPFMATVVVLIFLNLGIAAVSTPANIGGFELSMVAALKLFSIDTESSISCAVAFHFATVIPNLILALVVVWVTGFNPFNSKRIIPTSSSVS
jgi:uncharacterized protein (TIRG00374 family)